MYLVLMIVGFGWVGMKPHVGVRIGTHFSAFIGKACLRRR